MEQMDMSELKTRKYVKSFAPAGVYRGKRSSSLTPDWVIYKQTNGDVYEWLVNIAANPSMKVYDSRTNLYDEDVVFTPVPASDYTVRLGILEFREKKDSWWLKTKAPDGLYCRASNAGPPLYEVAYKKNGTVYSNTFISGYTAAFLANQRYSLIAGRVVDDELFTSEFSGLSTEGYTGVVKGGTAAFIKALTGARLFDSSVPDGVYVTQHSGVGITGVIKQDGEVYAKCISASDINASAGKLMGQKFNKVEPGWFMIEPVYTPVDMTGYEIGSNGGTPTIAPERPAVRPKDMRNADPGLYEAADGSDWKVYVFPSRMGLKPLCLSESEEAYLPGNTFTKSYKQVQAHND